MVHPQQRSLNPIGVFHSSKKFPYQAARQAVDDKQSDIGFIELYSQQKFEQALQGLEGFSHLWVLFLFDQNEHWKPIVQPPRGPKQGLFATRSPYRPNSIGLSALEILTIEGLKIFVKSHDILDGSPILDLKPYVIRSDCFPQATQGWLEDSENATFELQWSPLFLRQLSLLESFSDLNSLRNFLIQQLSGEPTNERKKRVFAWQDKFVLAYRTWRCLFSILEENKIKLEIIYSAYSEEELEATEDPHQDKEQHRLFVEQFQTRGDLPKHKHQRGQLR